jgi:hypothetical protein
VVKLVRLRTRSRYLPELRAGKAPAFGPWHTFSRSAAGFGSGFRSLLHRLRNR